MKLLFCQDQAVRDLAKELRTAPCYVADDFGISPERIERLMYERRQYEPSGDGALIDAVRRHYGERAADLCVCVKSLDGGI